jgi:hypothetical protein
MKDKLVTLGNLAEFRTKSEAALLAKGYVTNTVNDLVNYYTKTNTYTKTEVDNLLAAIKQFTYESISAEDFAQLTPSASTMNKIYLVPASSSGHSSDASNVKQEYITVISGGSGTELDPYTYAWEKIGDTEISLSGYVTTESLNTTLQSYVTATSLATTLEGYQTKIDSSHKLSADLLSDGSTNKVYTGTEQTKLAGIEAGAQVNVIESIKVDVAPSGSSEGTSSASSYNMPVTNKEGLLVVCGNADIDGLFSSGS